MYLTGRLRHSRHRCLISKIVILTQALTKSELHMYVKPFMTQLGVGVMKPFWPKFRNKSLSWRFMTTFQCSKSMSLSDKYLLVSSFLTIFFINYYRVYVSPKAFRPKCSFIKLIPGANVSVTDFVDFCHFGRGKSAFFFKSHVAGIWVKIAIFAIFFQFFLTSLTLVPGFFWFFCP
jgi:hypothetical protein